MIDRVSPRAAASGALVSIALTLVLCAVALPLQSMAADPSTAATAWFAVSAVIAALIGGCVSSVGARAVTRRDGRLQGLVCGAILVLAATIAAAVMPPVFGYRFDVTAGWTPPLALVGLMLASILGGAFGARSEARATGLIAVRAPTTVDRYENEFFAGVSASAASSRHTV